MAKEKARIRVATIDDVPRLAELTGMLGYPADAGEFRPRLDHLLAQADHVILVAELDPS